MKTSRRSFFLKFVGLFTGALVATKIKPKEFRYMCGWDLGAGGNASYGVVRERTRRRIWRSRLQPQVVDIRKLDEIWDAAGKTLKT